MALRVAFFTDFLVAALRAARVPIAIATDSNPGSSPLTSPLLAMNMAATLFRMTVDDQRFTAPRRSDILRRREMSQHDPSAPANKRRRGFLLTLGTGGTAAVAVALKPLATSAPELPAVQEASQGYRDTQHVRDYYRTTKI